MQDSLLLTVISVITAQTLGALSTSNISGILQVHYIDIKRHAVARFSKSYLD